MDLEGIIIIYIGCVLLWVLGYFLHYREKEDERQYIMVNRYIATLFGRFGDNKYLNIRGILAQLIAFIAAIAFTLEALNITSRISTVRFCSISGFILLVSMLLVYYRK